MCDQSEVSYSPGTVVWVKLNSVWWPGIVADSEEVPSDVLKSLRKTPLAIVKFFQENEVFEFVHKLSNIYHYNCLKKNDYIRKGLDLYRSKNLDASSNMKLFPADVAHAEILTDGNPDILNDKQFQPEVKTTYADLFASTKKSPKKLKSNVKKKSSVQAATQQLNTSRIITHPRFIKLNSGLETDYEVRERKQEPIRAECDEEDNSPPTTYRCQDCDFSTVRLNVIVLHNKSHTRNYAKPTPSKAGKRKNISAVRVQDRPSVSNWEFTQRAEPVAPQISETNGTAPKPKKKGRPRKVIEPSSTAATSVAPKTKERETKTDTRPSVSKPKQSAPQKDAIQESLLEDWAEFDTEQDALDKSETTFECSVLETQEVSATEEIPVGESHSVSKKDEFDFDDSEEHLVIDKSKIRAGRKIPRVLEEKSEELEQNETQHVEEKKAPGAEECEDLKRKTREDQVENSSVENVRRRRTSKQEDTKEEIRMEERNSGAKNVRKRRLSKEEALRIETREENDENSAIESVKRQCTSKQEEAEIKIQEDTNGTSDSANVKRRRTLSGLRKKSDDSKTENHEAVEMTDGKRKKVSRARKTVKKEVKAEEEAEVAELTERQEGDAERENEIKNTAEEKLEESTPLVEIEEVHEEIEVGGEIEIEIEEAIDDEEVTTAHTSVSLDEDTENDSKEKEAAEFRQKVDELLHEVSVPSKLPELPRSLKKDPIKPYKSDSTKQDSDDDDGIIESISLINDDSSDGCEERNESTSYVESSAARIHKKHRSRGETQNPTSGTAVVGSADNSGDTSDSSPEIVSVEMPPSRSRGFVKKKPPTIPASTIMTASEKRPPVRFAMTSRYRKISPNQVMKNNNSSSISESATKIFKTVQQQKLQQSRARSQLKPMPHADAGHLPRNPSFGQQVARSTSRAASKLMSNKMIVVKPMPTQGPTTIDNIDLTGSKDPVVTACRISGATKSSRLTRPIFPRTTTSNKISKSKVTSNNVQVGSRAPTPKIATSTSKLVLNSGNAPVSLQNQSEIITVTDDLDNNSDNMQVEEIAYIVDEAGYLIAENENVSSTMKRDDILAKALQDTDVLGTEIASPSSSTTLLEPCNIVQNSQSTTVCENVTLNTSPIMSSFEAPSRTPNAANPISEISEYIIINDPDNIQ